MLDLHQSYAGVKTVMRTKQQNPDPSNNVRVLVHLEVGSRAIDRGDRHGGHSFICVNGQITDII